MVILNTDSILTRYFMWRFQYLSLHYFYSQHNNRKFNTNWKVEIQRAKNQCDALLAQLTEDDLPKMAESFPELEVMHAESVIVPDEFDETNPTPW